MKDKTKKELLKETSASYAKINQLEKLKPAIESIEEIKTCLKESESKYSELLRNIPQKIFYKDLNSVYVLCNQAYARDLHIKDNEIRGRTDYDFFPKELAKKYRQDDQRIIQSGIAENIEEKYMTNGHGFFVRTFKAPLRNRNGKIIGIFGIFWDITEQKKIEEQLRIVNSDLAKSNKRLKQLALRDVQTGLFNYRYLEEAMEAEFYRSKRYGNPFSVTLLDIDYFKSINDVYGHQFGDLVLKQLARCLKKIVRRYDVIVRFGGEEFLIISSGIGKSEVLLLARRILDAVSLFNFGNKKNIVKLKLSAAVVSSPEDAAIKAMDLIELAERIMEKAKQDGGDCVYSCEDTMKIKSGSKKIAEPADVKFLKERLEKLTKKSNQSLAEAVFAFASTIRAKDRYTGSHAERIVYYATEIARALGMPAHEVELVKQASTLHDLGKIGIRDDILLKPARLTKREFEQIKKHPEIGVDIIRPIQFLHSIIPLILYHHERWDGKGYPRGLKGDEIPLGARIIAIADVYQALISDRPYRPAFSEEEALKIINTQRGAQFDPKIVGVFLKILRNAKSRKF